jgi:DNA-binding GntR family transcriptional regulator
VSGFAEVHDGHVQGRARADSVAEALLAQILEGKLSPGAPLREVELTTTYHVSRNTVREALRLLTREGVVTHERHRGASVRRYTPREIQDLYAVRTLLQKGSAARAGRLTSDETVRLRALLDAADAAAAGDEAPTLQALNLEFHAELVALQGNPFLDGLFARVLAEVRLVLTAFLGVAAPWADRNRELLGLLERGDAAGFERGIQSYLADSCADATARYSRIAATGQPTGRTAGSGREA